MIARRPLSNGARGFFATAGAMTAVALIVTGFGALIGRPWYRVITWQLFAILALAFAVVGLLAIGHGLAGRLKGLFALDISLRTPSARIAISASIDDPWFGPALRRLMTIAVWVTGAVYLGAGLVVASASHRRFVIVVGIFIALAIAALRRSRSPRDTLALVVVCVTSWCLASGLTFTSLGDWLFEGRTEALAVPAFIFAAALVLLELCDSKPSASLQRWSIRSHTLAFGGAAIVFAAFAFRSDGLLDTWVPYHRSFVVDVASAIRAGYWPMWDVPSVYGFLSVLAVAATPSKNSWQGLFILTSIFVFVQSCMLFGLWRWGRSGSRNAIFSFLVALAVFGDGISRYPWTARLYPQGGMRFFWVLSLLFICFGSYVWRSDAARVRNLRRAGHAVWLISLYWSFETGVWGTVVWGVYLLAVSVLPGPGSLLVRLARAFRPLVLLPLLALGVIEAVYAIGLHHGPDLFAYVEFTGLFVAGSVIAPFPANPDGAVWSILLMLIAAGAVLLRALRAAQWEVVPLLATTWVAIWATSTYYSVEPFDGHVSLLLVVLAAAAAILTYVSREVLGGDTAGFFARLSFAPILILCVAVFLGEPARLAAATFPFTSGWTSDTLATVPPISGELEVILREAGVRPGDAVLLPSGQYWTEISQGMMFPVMRTKAGARIEYRAWAPLSPTGIEQTILGLSATRRQTYIDRHLLRTRVAGWYVDYRVTATCEHLSTLLVTARTIATPNYSASLCRYAGP